MINFWLISSFFFSNGQNWRTNDYFGAIQNIARCRIVLDLILNSNESDIDKFCNGLICTSDMSELIKIINQIFLDYFGNIWFFFF